MAVRPRRRIRAGGDDSDPAGRRGVFFASGLIRDDVFGDEELFEAVAAAPNGRFSLTPGSVWLYL
jgi:hypothetical protein